MDKTVELYDLNDDCLRELFSHLPNIDLVAAKSTCRRFRTIAIEVAKKRFKHIYVCIPKVNTMKEHTIVLRNFGQFFTTMSLEKRPRRGSGSPGDIEDYQVISLLFYCPLLVGLYLIRIDIQCLSLREKVWNNLRVLKLIDCNDGNHMGRRFPSLISACTRLEEYGFFGDSVRVRTQNRPNLIFGAAMDLLIHPNITRLPSELYYRQSSTIKHLAITDRDPGSMMNYLPNPQDLEKLFTLEFKCELGGGARNILVLANTNAKLLNLILNIPSRTEDFRKIAKSLRIWTNLMSYEIHTGFQLPDEICKLFPRLIYDGQPKRPREYLIAYLGCRPRYVYRYKWKRDTTFFEDGTDSEPLFREFQAWQAQMKESGIETFDL